VFLFSPKLIEETIKVFREENNLELSPEQANDCLNNLAGLFLAYKDSDTTGVSVQPQKRRTETPVVAFKDLLTHSLNKIEEDT
jgi:hypothetical protein